MHVSSGDGIQAFSAFIFCRQPTARQHAHKSMNEGFIIYFINSELCGVTVSYSETTLAGF